MRCLAALLSFLVPLLLSLPLTGQDPATPGGPAQEPLTVTALEDLVATIEDPAQRQQLLERLRALLEVVRQEEEPAAPATDVLKEVSAYFAGFTEEVTGMYTALVAELGRVPAQLRGFVDRLQDPEQRDAFLAEAGLVLLIGVVAELLALLLLWLLRRPRTSLSRQVVPPGSNGLRRLGLGSMRLGLDLVPPVAFVAVTLAGLALFPVSGTGGAILLAVVWAVAGRQIAMAAVRLLLAPDAEALRLLRIDDDLAGRLYRSIGRLLSLTLYGFFLLAAVAALPADEGLLRALRSLYGLVVLVASVAAVLKYRRVLRPSGDAGTLRNALGSVLGFWWIAAILYLLGLYGLWITDAEGGMGQALQATGLSLLWFALGALAIAVARRAVGRLARRVAAAAAPMPVLRERVPAYERSARTLLQVVLVVLTASLVLEAWGLAATQLLTSAPVLAGLATLVRVLLVVLLAMAVIDVATALTQHYLQQKEREGSVSGKVRTLVPLAHKAIKFLVGALATITVLSQIGLEIGPILATVGVLGLAIGFGAQTLVKDLITGVFILLEDTFSVGDVISVDGTGGLVESINIRTVRLRDVSGNVHSIPFSSVGKVTNMTKEYSRYLIEAGVAYREDVDEVIAVLRELGEELQRDPEFGPLITQPIEILGLDRFEDSAVVIRARLTTKPIQQWKVGREFNRRMKKAFDERGIEIPFPHRTIYLGQDKDGGAPPLNVVRQGEARAG